MSDLTPAEALKAIGKLAKEWGDSTDDTLDPGISLLRCEELSIAALPAAEAMEEIIEDLIVALQKAYLPGFVALKRSDVIELIERARAALPEKGENDGPTS